MGELRGRVIRLAAGLAELGITVGDRVATFMWNNQEHLECYAAVPSMGAVLHTINVRLSPAEIAYIANHAGDSVVVVDASLVPAFAPVVPLLETVHTIVVTGAGDRDALSRPDLRVLGYDELLDRASAEFAWPDLDERWPAGMCYTSGTTGRPKGVLYSHRSTFLHSMSVCSGNAVAMSARDRVLVLVPMFHANAWGWPYAALTCGAELVLPDRDLSPATVADLIATEAVTLTGGVPTLWTDVLRYVRSCAERPDLSSLRMLLCGGSAVPRSLIEQYRDELGVPLVQAWGMTEVSPLGAVAWPPRGSGADEAIQYGLTQGRLLFGVESRIVDEEGTALPADGESVGELQVRGPWVTRAYVGDESPDSFADGWLRTGDIATIDANGYLRITDRKKDIIKSGGEWISSVALETCLVAHDEVIDAAVIGVPDERWQERPLAVVALRDGAQVTPDALAAWLAERLPRWWVPERWSIVAAIPRTSVGKYDKKRLRDQLAAGTLEAT